MTVDKFGRHMSRVKVQRSLRDSLPYRLTSDGNIDVEKKIIHNVGEPVASTDAVTLEYVQKHAVNKAYVDDKCVQYTDDNVIDVRNHRVTNVASEPVASTDAVNKAYLDDKCMQYNNNNVIDMRNHRVTNVASEPVTSTDAVNKAYLDNKCVQYNDDNVIDARNYRVTNVADPTKPKDVTHKYYVDHKSVALHKDGWWFRNHPLTRVGPPKNYDHAVTVKYMRDNAITLKEGSFDAFKNKIENVASGVDEHDVVIVQQLEMLKSYTRHELYLLYNVLQDKMRKIKHKILHSMPRGSEGDEKSMWTDTAALIEKYDKSTDVKDWRRSVSE